MRELILLNSKDKMLQEVSEQLKFPLSEEDLSDISDVKRQAWIDSPGAQGITAIQYGIEKRFCYVSLKGVLTLMINPVFIQDGKFIMKQKSYESCISIDGIGKVRSYYTVIRPNKGSVLFYDIYGKEYCEILNRHDINIVCHEIDHMNGILINKKGKFYETRISRK